jgi:predicted DCC family thiol-disulfide oxidoreductase YuxK
MKSMARAVLLYDGDCGFCRWTARQLLAWDRHQALRAIAIQSRDADALLANVPPHRRLESWHLVTPDGRVFSAGDAVAPLARLLPLGRPLGAIASTFPRATGRVYRAIARNRGRLGSLVGARACAVEPPRRASASYPASM